MCKCERSVSADILKIHTRHFNFKGMELQTARESSYLRYCDTCVQLKLCVFHDELVRLMEFVTLLSPLLPHIGVVLWLAPDRPTSRQFNLLQSSPTYKISTWTHPRNQTANVKYKPEFIFKMGIHKGSYRTSVININP